MIILPRNLCALQDTFHVSFVIMDTRSGVFDNNGGQDYSLPLAGASTEQEILDRRAAAYEAAERERLAVRNISAHESVLQTCLHAFRNAPFHLESLWV